MKIYDDVKHDLSFYPKLRERSNKNKYVATKLERKYRTGIPIEKLADMLTEAQSLDRAWRMVLQHEPRLRGTDYDQGKTLAQKKVLDLGYEVGIQEFNKLAKEL